MFTAIFLGCLAVSAVIVALGVISDATGADTPGYKQPAVVSVPPVAVDPVVMSTEKKDLTPNGESIIGLRDPSLTVNSTAALVVTTEDYTTYGDRAIIKLTNATGASINLTGMCIKGKPVMQLAGQNGYVWEYSDYDAIEKEGEQFVEVSNDFIFDPVQAKQIGDFVWKELKPHKLYSLMLVGMHYNYEIGDVYHLTLTHVMNGGTMENIDTDVEVMGTSMSRDVGGVGATNLNLRVPSEAWALTLAKNAKLVGAGNAQRLNNRSNVVTVASSTWTGQADYFCDGTDDDVEIQAAIDYLDSIGGGTIQLTSGNYILSDTIMLKDRTKLIGAGNSTVIKPYDSSIVTIIDNGLSIDSIVESLYIDFLGVTYTLDYAATDAAIMGRNNLIIKNIRLSNFYCDLETGEVANIVRECYMCTNCIIENPGIISSSGGTPTLRGFFLVLNASQCIVDGVSSGYAFALCAPFDSCTNLSSCGVINSNSIGLVSCFNYCNTLSSCYATSNPNSAAFISFSVCLNISSCVSSNNSGTVYASFNSCIGVVNCKSSSNSGSTSETGFIGCKKVQQCSSDDSTKYSSSYADSGTANACADTAAGGYNS